MMPGKKRMPKKNAGKKARITRKETDDFQLEDWNHVESKLLDDSPFENEKEPGRNNSLEMEGQPDLWNEWQEDWLFGDLDRPPQANDTNANKKNPV